ncbi:hypothetical protein PABY_10740 [Pyrodictium abyssi]|uniref:Uncharacterized protein n=1 Tax=Pyrodictium abyssi TaxID=54256 RepID=A0ABN6ZMQ3_9CREN|nr:hypothetical protein PABY_10740 [Pyrodictium abyssi]
MGSSPASLLKGTCSTHWRRRRRKLSYTLAVTLIAAQVVPEAAPLMLRFFQAVLLEFMSLHTRAEG